MKLLLALSALGSLFTLQNSNALSLTKQNSSEYEVLFFNFTPSHINVDLSSCHRIDKYNIPSTGTKVIDNNSHEFKYVCPMDTYTTLEDLNSFAPKELVSIANFEDRKDLLAEAPFMAQSSTKNGTALLAKSFQGPWKITTQFLTDESQVDSKRNSFYRVYSDNLLVMKFSVDTLGGNDRSQISPYDAVQFLHLYAKPFTDTNTKYQSDYDYTVENLAPYKAPNDPEGHKVQFKVFARCDQGSGKKTCNSINITWTTNSDK